MKNLFQPAAFIALMCGVALAQSATPPPGNPGMPQTQAQPSTPGTSPRAGAAQPTRIAPGSVIPVQLTKTVDAKKAKNGDQVLAKVTMDMKTQSGDVLVPKDTKVIGHVTEAQARSKEQKESQLAIAFDHAVTKDGMDMQLPMSIQAVIGQQQNQADQSGGAPAEGGGGGGAPSAGSAPSGGSGGRSGSGMNGSSGASTGSPPATPSAGSGQTANAGSSRPPINAQTQGVIGISNLTLSPAANAAQGSVMTSEKNNVKLESGTMLLLKVNQ